MEDNRLSQYLRYLPAVFHEDPFVGRFLLGFEGILAGFDPINRPVAYKNYDIDRRGSAFQSSEGNITYLKVNDVSMEMSTGRGLNTVVLTWDGKFKARTRHDVFANAKLWNDWADWVGSNANTGDVVAVASYDALRNAPAGGSAETLLNAIGAVEAFQAQKGNVRSPYALLFIKGQDGAREASESYKGPNAHLELSYHDLLNIDGTVGLEQTLDSIHTYFDPNPGDADSKRTPTGFLDWLAGWVALTLRADWDEEAKRRLISRIVPIYKKRGTKAGLKEILEVYTNENVRIYEAESPAHFFQVEMTLSEQNKSTLRRKEKIAKAIIDQEKPAHTFYALKILVPTMQIINLPPERNNIPQDEDPGIRIGINTLLGTTTT